LSIDLLSNCLAALVDKNSINSIGDNLLKFYNYNQNFPLSSLYANWMTVYVSSTAYRSNTDACYPVTSTKINYSVNNISNGGYILNAYGSNNITNFYETSTSDLSSLTLINYSPITISATGFTTVTPSTAFRYYHLLFTPVNSGTSTLTVVLAFNYKNYSPVSRLDLSTGFISSVCVPNYLIKNINGITTTNNDVTLKLSNLNDCTVTTPSNNQLLQYNGSDWVNVSILPTSTVVGISDTQTLTNKTIDSTTNTITADKLHSATTDIVLNTATAPTAGQVLTASSSTAASWVTPSSGVTTYAALSDVQLTRFGNDQVMI